MEWLEMGFPSHNDPLMRSRFTRCNIAQVEVKLHPLKSGLEEGMGWARCLSGRDKEANGVVLQVGPELPLRPPNVLSSDYQGVVL